MACGGYVPFPRVPAKPSTASCNPGLNWCSCGSGWHHIGSDNNESNESVVIMECILKKEVADGLARLGIGNGDWVFFHTSLRSFGAALEGGADGLIDTLLDAVSPDGTIGVPTHSEISADVFDPKSADVAADLGIVPRVFAARKQAVRSCHPTHSDAGIGPDAEVWMSGHEDCPAAGPGAPLDKLRLHPQGKVLLVGVGLDRLTLIHLGESLARAPYIGPPWREDDPSIIPVRRWDGQVVDVCHSESPGCSEVFVKAEPIFREKGLIRETCVGRARLMVLRAANTIDVVRDLVARDPLYFLNDASHCDWCRRANLQVSHLRNR